MQWQLAFDRYAIAAAACDQLKYTSAMAHKVVCMKVAARADSKGRSQWLAVIYDRLARQQWAEMTYYNTDGFDVISVCLEVDTALLDDAMEEFDETSRRSKHWPSAGQSNSKYTGAGHVQRGVWKRGGSYSWKGAGNYSEGREPDNKRQRR